MYKDMNKKEEERGKKMKKKKRVAGEVYMPVEEDCGCSYPSKYYDERNLI